MPNWTKEQQLAINKEGTNIIISAGAGSGKTAVLTERVIRKLKDGVDINKLLVLTFTNEAANEMKARIRKAIKKEPSLKKQLDFIDSSYITTFDSFALSIVKKYNYLLNISKNVSIIDSSIINIKKEEFLEEIFNNLYEIENKEFLKLISDFCVKDDKDIKRQILKITNLLDLKYDKKEYLENYINTYYDTNHIDNIVNEYLNLILNIKEDIKNIYEKIIKMESNEKIIEYENALKSLINSKTYDEIKNNLNIKLPRIVKNSKEEKERINELLKKLKELTIYENEESLKETYISTKDYTKIIIEIILKLDEKINEYKKANNAYEFIDISKMAIKVVKQNVEIQNEIKYFYNEIMIDEYQDTNDLQEMFINLIENNNVYMVGDIKQSIYRFRNANPFIFKNKYDNYSQGEKGCKIDLVNNFRSREEVLEDINKIFNKIMDDDLGGADYITSHQMIFGNLIYKENKKENNFLEIYNYDKNENKDFSKSEQEAFIIAEDIKNKINNYLVIDKDTNCLRKSTYSDFCIIMDRGTDFDLYKKVFEYKNIPLTVHKDEVLTTEYDIFIIKNLAKLIIKIKENKFDQEFKYYFTSVARSYLFSLSDEEILNIFEKNNFKETIIYSLANEIAKDLDNLSCHMFLNELLTKFKFYEKLLTYKDIEKTTIRILYLQKLAKSLEILGYTPYSFSEYLSKMITEDEDIKYKVNTNNKIENSVKIMNIHKSKGLEFPICYYAGLYKNFNIKDMNERFIFDNKYGLITPYYDNAIGTLFTKILAKEKYLKEEISEKIRLLYVALTRAKEKMIFVAPINEEIHNSEAKVNQNIRLKYRSFLDILNTVKDNMNIKNIETKLVKDYNIGKSIDLSAIEKTLDKINKKNIEINVDIKNKEHFSKVNYDLKSKEEIDNMEYGTKIHYLFEVADFKKENDNIYINNFLNQDVIKNIKEADIYKEYEFLYEDNDITYHGIIDLMLVYKDHIDIIDYKLKDIDNINYKKQLQGYQKYIYNKTNKDVKIYLYSIDNNILKEI